MMAAIQSGASEAAPHFQWTRQFQQQKESYLFDLAVESTGSCYVGGAFTDPVLTLDHITLTNRSPGSELFGEQFLLKLDASGRPVWAKQGWALRIRGMQTDPSNHLFVTGYFTEGHDFFGGPNLPSIGGEDVFVAKFDSSGGLLWAQRGGGQGVDEGGAVAVDRAGSCYVLGSLLNSTNAFFGSSFITNPRPSTDSPFLAKYSGDGELQWVRFVEVLDVSARLDVVVDADGWIWVGGMATTGGAWTNWRVVLAKYDPSGGLVWSRRLAEGDGWSSIGGITVGSSGNVYVAGSYAGTNAWFDDFLLTNAPNWDHGGALFENGFLAKYSPDGQALWARSMAGAMFDSAYGVAIDARENCYVSGQYFSPLITFGQLVVTNAGGLAGDSWDSFLAKYDIYGRLLWVKPSSVPGYDGSQLLGLDPAGNCLVGGWINPTAEFSKANGIVAKLKTTVPPPLAISRGTDDLLLSWSSLAEDFYLESTEALNEGSLWSSNAVAPVTIGLSNVVARSALGAHHFYRLRRP